MLSLVRDCPGRSPPRPCRYMCLVGLCPARRASRFSLASTASARYTSDMSTTAHYAGLDVGGTTMKAGVVDDTGKPLGSASLPTEAHRGQDLGLERMCETIREAV